MDKALKNAQNNFNNESAKTTLFQFFYIEFSSSIISQLDLA